MTLDPAVRGRLLAGAGLRVSKVSPLSTGNNAALSLAETDDGRAVVIKQARPGAGLDIEGYMLRLLAERSDLPVPAVHLAEDALLVMDYLEARGRLDAAAQRHAADLVADLHGRTGDLYGLDRDTLIGPLHQPNPQGTDWIAFFRDHRLLHMATSALEEGGIDRGMMRRIDRLAGRLSDFIDDPAPPTLIHGDMWGGNVLAGQGRIVGFIDPAVYYADPEIELAFATLFGTFGRAFFDRYNEHRPLRPGFFEIRRDLYNLYPLLVHVRLFGGGYVGQVSGILQRLVG